MSNRSQRQPQGDANHLHDHVSDGDPLAELARLIGQTDPRSSFGRANAVPVNSRPAREASIEMDTTEPALVPGPPPWMRTANADHKYYEHEPAYEAATATPPAAWSSQFQHEDAPQLSPTPSFLAHVQHTNQVERAQDDARYDHVLYGQDQTHTHSQQAAYQQDDYPTPIDDYDAYAPPVKKKRGNLVAVGAVVALGVLGTASAFAYRTYSGHRAGEPPIIKAEPGAIKVAPPTSQGAGKPINERFASGDQGKEQIVPREEKPMDVTSATAPRVVFPPLNQQPSAPAVPQNTAARPSVDQANGAMRGDEPRKVRTVSVRPDQPDAAPVQRPSAAPAAATSSAPTQRAPVPSAAPVSAANAPMSLSPQNSAAPIRTAAVLPAAGGGNYLIQIASQRTEADAMASYRVVQAKFPSLLGSRNPIIRKADLGEKGMYYRALVGPFASAEEAGQFCGNLRSAGGQCVIHRN